MKLNPIYSLMDMEDIDGLWFFLEEDEYPENNDDATLNG